MYFMMAVALLFVLPAACILGQSLFEPHAISALMVGKWLAFWAVGMRLLLAGMRQMLQPRYTAEVILGLKSADALLIDKILHIYGYSFHGITCSGLTDQNRCRTPTRKAS